MSETVQIEGLAELSELLTELTPRAAKRYLKRCAEPAAQVVIAAMEETVPVGVGILEESLESQTRFINDGGDQTTMQTDIGPTKQAFWGSFNEFGTSKQAGIHWMGNAWEASKDKCLDVFQTELTGLILDLENRKS